MALFSCSTSESKQIERQLRANFLVSEPDTTGSGALVFDVYSDNLFADHIKIKGTIDKTLNKLPDQHTERRLNYSGRSFVEAWNWETINTIVTMEAHITADSLHRWSVKLWITPKN